jgi:hypothetical protein
MNETVLKEQSRTPRQIIDHEPYRAACDRYGFSQDGVDLLIKEYMGGFEPVSAPVILHMLGVPASGKTTYVRQNIPANTIVVGFDDVMERIPLYHDDLKKYGKVEAFARWELCARQIGYEILFRSLDLGLNVIFDHGGSREDHLALLTWLKGQGRYKVHMFRW